MKYSDINDFKSMMAEATRLGDELTALEKRNRKRKAKGRKPLPDPQDTKDALVLRTRHKTGYAATVGSEDALKLYEMRKEQMEAEPEDDMEDDLLDERDESPAIASGPLPSMPSAMEAVMQAEAVRRVEDMKSGRIDHEGNWSKEGQTLEGGDATNIRSDVPAPSPSQVAWDTLAEPDAAVEEMAAPMAPPPEETAPKSAIPDWAKSMRDDLYRRLKISFEGIERTLSDMQGRISEIVVASTPRQEEPPANDEYAEFRELLGQRSPVVFDVGGTQMTFDAICVFPAPPCITVVSKIGSAKITPKPGAQLHLTYDMDGTHYENDPVTFLGTRFDLPMFGLSFVGFIRDSEASLIDAAAGLSE